jgi:hypothetical protein
VRREALELTVLDQATVVTPGVSDDHGLHLVEQQLMGHTPEVGKRRLEATH